MAREANVLGAGVIGEGSPLQPAVAVAATDSSSVRDGGVR